MQDSTQAEAAPPDETTPQGRRHPHPVGPSALTYDCIFCCGAAGNRTRRINCLELVKPQI